MGFLWNVNLHTDFSLALCDLPNDATQKKQTNKQTQAN